MSLHFLEFPSALGSVRFRERGLDEKRLLLLLDGKKNCRCTRKTCFQRLTSHLDTLQDFLSRFYGLEKLDQDEVDPFV